ncbi:MAG: DUF3037 domain-containing protein [Paramuribaculum sp.]|nr:DUF3037 domain-containing protein [Paramuribaculum sp.]
MNACEPLVYEYALLRYVPDVERGEFMNVGLMMMCKRARWMRVAVKVDADRLRALTPRADIGLLERQLSLFTRTDVPAADSVVEERYRWLAAAKSAIIQTSPSHPGLVDSRGVLDATFDELFACLVECVG